MIELQHFRSTSPPALQKSLRSHPHELISCLFFSLLKKEKKNVFIFQDFIYVNITGSEQLLPLSSELIPASAVQQSSFAKLLLIVLFIVCLFVCFSS